jgi:hypothetical protein
MEPEDFVGNGFIANIPYVIGADGTRDYDPRLVGLPVNILYTYLSRTAGRLAGAISALYKPDIATFHETERTKELTYRNSHGGDYRVLVCLDKGTGKIETTKYRGDTPVCHASGPDFDSAMTHTTLGGIHPDERVRLLKFSR